MPIAHLLQDFTSTQPQQDERRLVTESELEDLRLAAFEKGYGAGWDDALKTQNTKQMQLADGLEQALGDASFSFHEARAQLEKDLRPVFQCLLDRVLPDAIRITLAPRIADQITELSIGDTAANVVIFVAPENADGLGQVIENKLNMNVSIASDSSLGPAEAVLKLGPREVQLDPAEMLSDIKNGVDAFFHGLQENSEYG